MCGIAGLWNRHSRPVARPVLAAMATSIAHRGPDDAGYHYDDAAGVGLAHRRLSILDLSSAGHQPMPLAERYWLTYNGEVYNFRELRAELETLGHRFTTQTDSEVLLHSYQQWGPDAVTRWNGMWALAIWDAQEHTLFLSRDRLGVKPLYLTEMGQTIAFASEIKALLAHPDLVKTPNPTTIADFLHRGLQDHTAETFFAGIEQLHPGHWRLYRQDGSVTQARFWQIDPANKRPIGFAEATEEFRSLFTDAVRLRLLSDVPVGTCLSGGLDSSAIVAVMSELAGSDRVKTFSARFAEPEWDEGRYIEIVRTATGAVGHDIYPDVDGFLADLEPLLRHQDEPFASMSIFAQWCVMRKAREAGVTVLLDGQGSDEQLAGYGFWGAHWAILLGQGRLAALWRSWQDRRAIAGRSLGAEMASTLGGFRQHGTAGFDRLDGILHDYLTRSRLPALLHWEDRNSMAFGREARVPFLDYRLVEFTFSLPDEHKLRDGWDKAVLRQSGLLPDAIARRRDKMGFVTPQSAWLSGPLQPVVAKTLAKPVCPMASDDRAPVWQRFILERWWRQHFA